MIKKKERRKRKKRRTRKKKKEKVKKKTEIEEGSIRVSVVGADVELDPQFLLGTVAEFAKLELAQLVAEGLRGPRDVAIGFGLDCRLVDGTRLSEEIDDLITCPAF